MVCHGCTYTACIGMDCPELKNTAALIQAIAHQLKSSSLSEKQTGTSTSPCVSAAECPKPVEECQ